MASWSRPPADWSSCRPVFQSTSSTAGAPSPATVSAGPAPAPGSWKMASMRPRTTQGPTRRGAPTPGSRGGGVGGGRCERGGAGGAGGGVAGEVVDVQEVGEAAGAPLQQAVDHDAEPGL